MHKSHTLLISQLEEFPEGDNDDAPDSLQGAYMISKLSKKRGNKKEDQTESKDKNLEG